MWWPALTVTSSCCILFRCIYVRLRGLLLLLWVIMVIIVIMGYYCYYGSVDVKRRITFRCDECTFVSVCCAVYVDSQTSKVFVFFLFFVNTTGFIFSRGLITMLKITTTMSERAGDTNANGIVSYNHIVLRQKSETRLVINISIRHSRKQSLHLWRLELCPICMHAHVCTSGCERERGQRGERSKEGEGEVSPRLGVRDGGPTGRLWCEG